MSKKFSFCKCHLQVENIVFKKVQWNLKNRCIDCGKRVYHRVREKKGRISLKGFLLRLMKDKER